MPVTAITLAGQDWGPFSPYVTEAVHADDGHAPARLPRRRGPGRSDGWGSAPCTR
ncbi:hypothetical protein NKH18_00055 [Streptomyces sp. M10(2022)]